MCASIVRLSGLSLIFVAGCGSGYVEALAELSTELGADRGLYTGQLPDGYRAPPPAGGEAVVVSAGEPHVAADIFEDIVIDVVYQDADFCAELGYYGDGACDSDCPWFDPDCVDRSQIQFPLRGLKHRRCSAGSVSLIRKQDPDGRFRMRSSSWRIRSVGFPRFAPASFAATIFRDRYVIHDGQTFAQACQRVAGFIAQAEEGAEREGYAARFHDLLVTNRFSPGGRVWRGSGWPRGQLGNCFTWTDALDSREGWGDALRAVTIISGTGGGVGLNFSKVRPRGSPIRGTGGTATGSVSLMRCITAVCNELGEDGGHRSALMLCLRYDHPDLPEFLEAKLDRGQLKNANNSVLIDDEFLQLVDEDGAIVLQWNGEERGRIRAREVWARIVRNAWATGDPGLLNLGVAERMNTLDYRVGLAVASLGPRLA